VAARPCFVVSLLGADRPGIVAGVTGALFTHGCNLEDSSAAVLHGHFAMVFVVSAPPGTTGDELRDEVAGVAGDLGVTVHVTEIGAELPARDERPLWSLTLYGADRPGIVHRVTSVLADRGVNVVDMRTALVGDLYVMELEVALPADVEGGALEAALDATTEPLGIRVTLTPPPDGEA
jgi:glycine cleavage system transcriptional repressor